MKIPNSIEPCPIVEAIFEVRFNSILPGDAIFGVIYQRFKDEYPKLEKLPILQLPDEIRSNDPNLIFQPSYKLVNQDYIIQIGQRAISLIKVKPYSGWKEYSKKIQDTFSILINLEIFNIVNRISIRYINFFENDNIIKNSNIKFSIKDSDFTSEFLNIETQINNKNSSSILRLLSKAQIGIQNAISNKGSIIDIDTSIVNISENVEMGNTKDDLMKIIYSHSEIVHDDSKTIFFSILSESYLATLTVK